MSDVPIHDQIEDVVGKATDVCDLVFYLQRYQQASQHALWRGHRVKHLAVIGAAKAGSSSRWRLCSGN